MKNSKVRDELAKCANTNINIMDKIKEFLDNKKIAYSLSGSYEILVKGKTKKELKEILYDNSNDVDKDEIKILLQISESKQDDDCITAIRQKFL